MWKWIIYSVIFLKENIKISFTNRTRAIIPVQVYSCGNCGHINTKVKSNGQPSEETTNNN